MFARRLAACVLAALSVSSFAVEVPAEPARGKESWALELPGFSYHFEPPSGTGKVKKWNQTNWGAGVEYRNNFKDDNWFKATGGVMLDSTKTWGPYVGAVLQKRVIKGDISVDLGGGAFLFYRGKEDGTKALIPGVLPVVSVQHERSGLGFNFIVIPKFSTDTMSSPTTLYLQGVYRF